MACGWHIEVQVGRQISTEHSKKNAQMVGDTNIPLLVIETYSHKCQYICVQGKTSKGGYKEYQYHGLKAVVFSLGEMTLDALSVSSHSWTWWHSIQETEALLQELVF